MAAEIKTQSGGTIDFGIIRSAIKGSSLYLHIDQTSNVRNGDDEASILLNVQECKEIIWALNEFIKYEEGKDYVFTSDSVVDLISRPEVQEAIKIVESRILKENINIDTDESHI